MYPGGVRQHFLLTCHPPPFFTHTSMAGEEKTGRWLWLGKMAAWGTTVSRGLSRSCFVFGLFVWVNHVWERVRWHGKRWTRRPTAALSVDYLALHKTPTTTLNHARISH